MATMRTFYLIVVALQLLSITPVAAQAYHSPLCDQVRIVCLKQPSMGGSADSHNCQINLDPEKCAAIRLNTGDVVSTSNPPTINCDRSNTNWEKCVGAKCTFEHELTHVTTRLRISDMRNLNEFIRGHACAEASAYGVSAGCLIYEEACGLAMHDVALTQMMGAMCKNPTQAPPLCGNDALPDEKDLDPLIMHMENLGCPVSHRTERIRWLNDSLLTSIRALCNQVKITYWYLRPTPTPDPRLDEDGIPLAPVIVTEPTPDPTPTPPPVPTGFDSTLLPETDLDSKQHPSLHPGMHDDERAPAI